MRRGRCTGLLWLITAAAVVLGATPVLGAPVPGEEIPGAEVPGIEALGVEIPEDIMDGISGNPEQEEEASPQEIDQIIEDYFKQIESGEIGTGEDVTSVKITDPPLKMARAENGGLRYTLPNGNSFVSSIPKGMVSGEPVDLTMVQGALGLVQVNGGQASVPSSWHFTEPGSYEARLLFYQDPSKRSQDYNVYEVNFAFVITGGSSRSLSAVPAPEGFAITGVRKDGRMQDVENERCVFLEGDGRFEILYEDTDTGGLHYQTSFVRDTTAPFLSFSKELGKGALTAPVNFTPSEPGCRISMSYNGNKSYVLGDTLTAAGSYDLAVEDSAGNQRSYHLRIRQTYKLMDYRVVIIALLAIVGTAARLLFLRRNMRVL